MAVFSTSHHFTRLGLLTWLDLAAAPVLALRRGNGTPELSEAGFTAPGLTLQPAFESNYVGSLIGMVDAGLGVAIVPDYVTILTDKNRIASKRINNPTIEREVLMVHRAGLSLSPAAQAFTDFLQQEFNRQAGGKSRA